jgi:hypothetical protein
LAIFKPGHFSAFLKVELNCEPYTVTERPLISVLQNMPVAVSSIVPMSVVQQCDRFDVAVKLDGRSNISLQFYRIPSLNMSSRPYSQYVAGFTYIYDIIGY